MASATDAGRTKRLALAFTALAVGVASLVALISLLHGRGHRSYLDAMAVFAAVIASLGHIVLGVKVLFAGRRWPLRRGVLTDLLRFAGWASILAAVAAATMMLDVAPMRRIVRGVEVNGVLEFTVTAMFFALPGAMLLSLRMLALRAPRRRPSVGSRSGVPQADRCPFIVDLSDRIHENQVTTAWTDAPRTTTPAVEERIARIWEAQAALADVAERRLFNGELVRLIGWSRSGPSLHLAFGPTCYRDFVGTNMARTDGPSLPRECLAGALGVSALVITSDGFMALGRRGTQVALHGGYLHGFGGLVDAADRRPDKTPDVFAALRRELVEELNVRAEEIGEVVITGLVRDHSLDQPELLFDVNLNLTRAQLLARFDPAASDQEHTEIEFAADEPQAVLPLLKRGEPVAPVAAAAVLLHGRQTWSTEWYEQTCFILYGDLPTLRANP